MSAMGKQRYSSVSGEEARNATEDRAEADNDTTQYRFELDERREETDETAPSDKADKADTAQAKQLHSATQSRQQQRSEESEADVDEEADEVDHHGFHPARLQPSSSTALLHSSSSSSPLSRLVSFLRLNLNRYYVVLLVALLAISCSGTLLRELPNTPPLLKGQHLTLPMPHFSQSTFRHAKTDSISRELCLSAASVGGLTAFWRLLFMSGVLSIGFIYQYREADSALIDRFLSNECLLAILVGGLAASAHFGFWIWSLNHTSLAHSLFFVSCYPLVTVAVMLVQRKSINWKEVVGVLLGLAGSALLLADTSTTAADAETSTAVPVSVAGDIVAFLGAVVFVVYLYAGRSVRGWLPLFLYTAPMTAVSCVPLLFCSLLLEDVTFRGFTPSSIFGFLSPASLLILCLIALLPAGLGHTGINFALQHVSPLAISVVLTLEPVLGVVVGVAAGVEVAPSLLTVVGGCGSVVGCVTAIVGTHQRETREKREAEERERARNEDDNSEEPAQVDDSDARGMTEVELIVSDEAADDGSGKGALHADTLTKGDEQSPVVHADKG